MTTPTEHWSDCAVHNEPALPAGPCDCGGLPPTRPDGPREALKALVEHIGARRYRCGQTGLRLDGNIPEFEGAERVLADSEGAEPDNETLRNLGAFERKTRVGKHQATNWVHLRQTIDALDAAGQTDAADTLIWVVWHEVNGTARAREYHRLAVQDGEHKTNSLRTEIAAKVGAYREIKMLEDGIRDAIAVCEQDARNQDHNAGTAGFGRNSRAYAEGRGTACRGIAARLRALLPDPLPAPATPQEETP